jgi:hypothetical protein
MQTAPYPSAANSLIVTLTSNVAISAEDSTRVVIASLVGKPLQIPAIAQKFQTAETAPMSAILLNFVFRVP